VFVDNKTVVESGTRTQSKLRKIPYCFVLSSSYGTTRLPLQTSLT